MIGESSILTDNEIIFLDEEKPLRLVGCTWELVFSTELHEYSLSTLYRNIKLWTGPTLLVVKDKRGNRFGAFVTESFKPDDKIHGGGECFVFRLKHDNFEKLFDDPTTQEEGNQLHASNVKHLNNGKHDENDRNVCPSTSPNLILREEHFSAVKEESDTAENNYNSGHSIHIVMVSIM